jgi:hypothetical protein
MEQEGSNCDYNARPIETDGTEGGNRTVKGKGRGGASSKRRESGGGRKEEGTASTRRAGVQEREEERVWRGCI